MPAIARPREAFKLSVAVIGYKQLPHESGGARSGDREKIIVGSTLSKEYFCAGILNGPCRVL